MIRADRPDDRPCPVCWAWVRAPFLDEHEAWHSRIAQVAIETTARLVALERQTKAARR